MSRPLGQMTDWPKTTGEMTWGYPGHISAPLVRAFTGPNELSVPRLNDGGL